MDTVTIGCKLPHGMILENGYEVVKIDKQGREFASVRRLASYKRIRLNGWHDASGATATIKAGMLPPPSMLNPGVGITKDVPRDFWDAWKKAHAEMFGKLNATGILFEAKDGAEASAKAIDSAAPSVRAGFEPLNPRKLPVAGVEKAKFDE